MSEHKQAVATTAKRALSDLLQTVTYTNAAPNTARTIWGAVLGTSSPEDLARAHTAGVALLQDAIAELAALPDLHDQVTGYIPEWWDVLIAPHAAWDADGTGNTLGLPTPQLHVLEGYARDVERQRPHIAMSGVDAVAALNAMAMGWREFFLRESDLGLDFNLRDQLLGELEQLLWLLNRPGLYGVPIGQARRVVQRTTELTPTAHPKSQKTLWGMVVGGTAILGLIAGGAQDAQTTVDSMAGIYDTVGCEVVKTEAMNWAQRCVPTSVPQLEQPKQPKQLGPGRRSDDSRRLEGNVR